MADRLRAASPARAQPTPPPHAGGRDRKDDLVRCGVLCGDRAFTGPYAIQLGIEGNCNYSCVFCAGFSPLRPWPRPEAPHGGHMPPRAVHRLVESAAQLDVEQISFVGLGEPMLHPDAAALFEHVKAKGIRLMVTTNGSRLNQRWSTQLLDARVDILNVSFSAGTRATYAAVHGPAHAARFDSVRDSVRALAAERRLRGQSTPRLVMRCTVVRGNIEELVEWVDVAVECGADELVLQAFASPGFGDHLAPSSVELVAAAANLEACLVRLEACGVASNLAHVIERFKGSRSRLDASHALAPGAEYYRHHPCLVGWTYAVVLESGEVRPCCYCATSLGNIYEQPFEEIWHGDSYNRFRRGMRSLPVHGREEPGCTCFSGCGSVRDNVRTIKRLGLQHEAWGPHVSAGPAGPSPTGTNARELQAPLPEASPGELA